MQFAYKAFYNHFNLTEKPVEVIELQACW